MMVWATSQDTNCVKVEELSGAGFSLWGLVCARTKFHRLKPAPLKTSPHKGWMLSEVVRAHDHTKMVQANPLLPSAAAAQEAGP
jgi:hypothetical protein